MVDFAYSQEKGSFLFETIMIEILGTIGSVIEGKELFHKKAKSLVDPLKIKTFASGKSLDLLLFGLTIMIGLHIFFPAMAEAVVDPIYQLPYGAELEMKLDSMLNKSKSPGDLPIAKEGSPARILMEIPVTAYSSDVWQTDSTPFITASGTTTRRGVVAANFLPIGTRVRFPDLYGNEVFIVEDRMNRRYDEHLDIWMEETADAINFGLQFATIEVF